MMDFRLPRFALWNGERLALIHQWFERLPGVVRVAQEANAICAVQSQWKEKYASLVGWVNQAVDALSPAQVLELEPFSCSWPEGFLERYRNWVHQQFLAASPALIRLVHESKEVLQKINKQFSAWGRPAATVPAEPERDAVAELLEEAVAKLRDLPSQVVWPDRPAPRLPQVLVIDDELGRLTVPGARLSEKARQRLHQLQAAFCNQFHLLPGGGSPAIRVNQPVGEAWFCAGQRYDDRHGFVNDLGVVKEVVATGEYALVLVDVVFNAGEPDDSGMGNANTQFGVDPILPWLRKNHPDLPVVALTADPSGQVINRIHSLELEYLHKTSDEVDLFHHILGGQKATPEQLRAAMCVPDDFVAYDRKMLEVVWEAWRIARKGKGEPILILGESGAGKERLARFIHNASQWESGPFVTVNCAALPKELSDSILFGYYARAYAGAAPVDTPGYFHQADGGTLVLDEFAELPDDVQAKLLRALQKIDDSNPRLREIQPVGPRPARTTLATEVSALVVACTNRDRESLRQDIVARFPHQITIPPLHERKDDVVPLAQYLLKDRLGLPGLRLSEDAQAFLKGKRIRSNVRTLERLLKKAAEGKGQVNIIREQDLVKAWEAVVQPPPPPPQPPEPPKPPEPVGLPEAVAALLRKAGPEEWRQFTVEEGDKIKRALEGQLVKVVATLLEWALSQAPDVPSLAEYLTNRKLRGREPQDVVKRWLKLDSLISERVTQLAPSLKNETLQKLIKDVQDELKRRRPGN
jgi:DNA-binding NtrC family response regulator